MKRETILKVVLVERNACRLTAKEKHHEQQFRATAIWPWLPVLQQRRCDVNH